MTHLAGLERTALCDTLTGVGPDAPTLCSPWTTRDLAAHLLVRERRPDLAAGIWVPGLAPLAEHGMRGYAARPWPELVDLVRGGPPPWSPARVASVDDAVNLLELFIHHEDVLRGDERVGPRRQVSDHLSAALWKSLRRTGKLHFRRSPVGVVLETASGRTADVRPPTGHGTVVLRGTPSELVLVASGRRRVADVEAVGRDDAVAALWSAELGLG